MVSLSVETMSQQWLHPCPYTTADTQAGQALHGVVSYLEARLWILCLGPVCMCPEVSSRPWRLLFHLHQWERTVAALTGWQ